MNGLIVIGGGPAGVMAALTAAQNGVETQLWERNKSLGRKLAITGKGRCNITNNAPLQELVRQISGNGAFMYSALSRFGPAEVMDFFEQDCALPLKTERGRRVFPQSDRAADVVAALRQQLERAGVNVVCQRRAKRLELRQGRVCGVYDYSGACHSARAVVVACGGMTYPATGSTGDGYQLAAQAGHSIVAPKPSLVPLETVEEWPKQLSGLSLKNVELRVTSGERLLAKDFGELLFTHFGLSGPIVLSLSRPICAQPQQGRGLGLLLDLKPALSLEQLDQRLQRDFGQFSRRRFANSLEQLLPASMIPVFVQLSGVEPELPVNQLAKAQRRRIGELLKALPLTVSGPRPLAEAIVTAGGVNVRELEPKTMASRLAQGLYFAGEVMDVDGWTGGYNLQVAWSSGRAAGLAAAAYCQQNAEG